MRILQLVPLIVPCRWDCIPSGVGGGGGGKGNQLYKPYRYVPPQRVWYLGLIGLKTGIHLPILI